VIVTKLSYTVLACNVGSIPLGGFWGHLAQRGREGSPHAREVGC